MNLSIKSPDYRILSGTIQVGKLYGKNHIGSHDQAFGILWRDEMVSDLNSRSDLWADPSITRNAVGKYRCDRLIPPLRSSGSDLYGRDRQYKNTQFIKTAYRVAGRYSLSRLWFLRIGGDRSPYPKDLRPSGRRDRFRRKRGFSDHGVATIITVAEDAMRTTPRA